MFKGLKFYALLLCLCANQEATADALAQRIERAAASIVMIEAETPAGRHMRGAGFVYDAAGRIATAFHVVENASAIHIAFRDGRRATARIVAKDGPFDLALLAASIPVSLPPLPIETRPPAAGVHVLAIGNPFGHGFSVSAGIVSGHDRTYDPLSPHGFLQHDAALNPGSSGGPLLDGDNRVIGVNAAIPNGRRSDVGVGFAIPGSVAARVLKKLASEGALRHGRIGARLRLLDAELARALGESAGALAIEEVEAGGAAERAGARPGDILRTLDGRPLRGLRQISEAVVGGEPGARLTFEGVRSGKPLRFEIELTEMPMPPESGRPAPAAVGSGLSFAGAGEAVVRAVAPDSPAGAAGLKEGDRILAVGPRSVSSAGDARDALDSPRSGSLALLVKREGLGARYIVLSGRSDGLAGAPLEGNREIETSAPF